MCEIGLESCVGVTRGGGSPRVKYWWSIPRALQEFNTSEFVRLAHPEYLPTYPSPGREVPSRFPRFRKKELNGYPMTDLHPARPSSNSNKLNSLYSVNSVLAIHKTQLCSTLFSVVFHVLILEAGKLPSAPL